LTLTWRCVPKSVRHVRSVLLPFDNYEAYADLCQTTWCSRLSWRWCLPGLTTAPQLLPAFRSNSWTDFSLCKTPLHGWSSTLAVAAQITPASDARTRFVPAGSANVSLPPRLCTWLPGFRSSARVTPQRTSTTALFDYISAGRSTHCAFYHWRPHLSSDCCIGLEQFAGVSPVIAVVAHFPQQTENRIFCPVLQPWRRTSHCTDYYCITWLHCLSLLLRVLVVIGLNATLKFIRPSPLSSSPKKLGLLRPGIFAPDIGEIYTPPVRNLLHFLVLKLAYRRVR